PRPSLLATGGRTSESTLGVCRSNQSCHCGPEAPQVSPVYSGTRPTRTRVASRAWAASDCDEGLWGSGSRACLQPSARIVSPNRGNSPDLPSTLGPVDILYDQGPAPDCR